jgi:hypothetical protein
VEIPGEAADAIAICRQRRAQGRGTAAGFRHRGADGGMRDRRLIVGTSMSVTTGQAAMHADRARYRQQMSF